VNFFSFFLFLFSSTKSEKRKAEKVLPRVEVGTSGKGQEKGIER
jgi:hypothetical protein